MTPEEVKAAVRAHLAWSWNYGVAEELAEDTLRHNAQAISGGIERGEDQDDQTLIADFVYRRCDDDDHAIIDEEWVPEDGPDADGTTSAVYDELVRLLLETPKEGEHNEGNHQ